ncbi:hypothetical protein AGMMS50276_16310 [Synergistales bacterium]|nr:hypothetical protein AGMMS50276_16310 [Synergistales bacterium]
MAKYDILREPWLPLLKKDDKLEKVGLMDALKNAHDYAEVVGENPLETASILRLLIAFLMDAYRLENTGDRKRLYKAGQFDGQLFEDYVTRCIDEGASFDLFDEKRPFMQSAYDKEIDKEQKPVAVLSHALPSGNNHTHFDHRLETEHVLTTAQCLPKILASYVFACAMTQGYPSSVNGTPCFYIFCNGETLFETLVFNMMSSAEMPKNKMGEPAWRSKATVTPKEQRAAVSILEAMTFMPRRVTLVPPDNDGYMRKVYFQQGLNFSKEGSWEDSHVACKRNKKGELYTLKPDTSRACWRDLGTLAANNEDKGANVQPPVIRQLGNVTDSEAIVDLQMFGLVTNKAKYEDWIQDRLRVPYQILEEYDLGAQLRKDIDAIESVARIVHWAAASMNFKKADKKDEFALQIQARFFDAMHRYLFGNYLKKLSKADVTSDEWTKPLIEDLNNQLQKASNEALTSATERLGFSARGMEAAATALRFAAFRRGKILREREWWNE